MENLFVYGTLMPRSEEEAARDGCVRDAVRGRLYDWSGAFPVLVDTDDTTAGWVYGWVRPVTMEQLDGPLDAWEEVAYGMYERKKTTTKNGLDAWVYVYKGSLKDGMVGPLERWENKRGYCRDFQDIIDPYGRYDPDRDEDDAFMDEASEALLK